MYILARDNIYFKVIISCRIIPKPGIFLLPGTRDAGCKMQDAGCGMQDAEVVIRDS